MNAETVRQSLQGGWILLVRYSRRYVEAVYDRPQFGEMQAALLWAVIDRPYIGESRLQFRTIFQIDRRLQIASRERDFLIDRLDSMAGNSYGFTGLHVLSGLKRMMSFVFSRVSAPKSFS